MNFHFKDRQEAGKLLAERLRNYQDRQDTLILALPRGGVPVGFMLAIALHLPLDICLVRKLGVPRHRELAMGAIASPDIVIINQTIVADLRIPEAAIDATIVSEKQELERRAQVYRQGQNPPEIAGKNLILVDDGIATGATLKAAISALRRQQPQSLIVAVPIASSQSCQEIAPLVEELICLETESELSSISRWYADFSQVSDEEVCELLQQAWQGFP